MIKMILIRQPSVHLHYSDWACIMYFCGDRNAEITSDHSFVIDKQKHSVVLKQQKILKEADPCVYWHKMKKSHKTYTVRGNGGSSYSGQKAKRLEEKGKSSIGKGW